MAKKKLYQIFIGVSCLAVFIIITSQSTSEIKNAGQQLPVELVYQLDSLKKADDLAGWLYRYREYVYEDPVKRISLLTNAQSSAWRKCKTDAEREEWFSCLAASGYYLLYSGNILRSIDAYEQAYRFYFEKPIPNADVLEYVLKPLGNNYTRLGDYDRAFFIQEKSLALAEAKDSSQLSSICHNLATTAIWKEELALAKQYCEKGLMQVNKNSPLQGLLLSTVSEVFLKTGKRDSAEYNCRLAINILTRSLSGEKRSNVPYWLRGAWQGLGDIQKEKDQPAGALASYQKAISLIDQYYSGERKREKAQLSILSGRMFLQLKQPEKAMAQFNTALSLMIPSFRPETITHLPEIKSLYGENSILDALHGKADCLKELDKKEEALQCYLLLYTVERKLRREFFSNTAKQQQQRESRRWAESAIETAFELWKTSRKAAYANQVLIIAEMSKAQLLLDEIMNNFRYRRIQTRDSLLDKQQQMMQAISFYEKETMLNARDSNALLEKKELQFELSLLQKQVKEKYPLQEKLMTGDELPSADNLLKNIEAGTTVVEFFTGQRNIYCIKAGKNRVEEIKKTENADSVIQAVKIFVDRYFQQGPANMMNNPGHYYEEAFAVYKTLLKNTGIEQKGNCVIIPDGILGYLPFDALITDAEYKQSTEQWPFFIKQTNLYFSYSLQTMLQQKGAKHTGNSFSGFFISFDSSSQSVIPAVKKEYEEIHDVVKGNFFREKDASIAVFNEQLEKANALHISTHSFLQGRENIPMLQLADDKFFLFELYGKTFRPQLVVLSACRTGHGMLAEGEGIISLARGFTASGATGIVAGLWNMNDETTARLMGMFYRHLNEEQSPATALHNAKLQWLEQKNRQQFEKLPYFWAGMVYSGDNLPVQIKSKKPFNKLWWIALLAAAGLLYLSQRRKK